MKEHAVTVLLLLASAVTLVTGVALFSPRASVIVAAVLLAAAAVANIEVHQ